MVRGCVPAYDHTYEMGIAKRKIVRFAQDDRNQLVKVKSKSVAAASFMPANGCAKRKIHCARKKALWMTRIRFAFLVSR
jgi:hypothetical protein